MQKEETDLRDRTKDFALGIVRTFSGISVVGNGLVLTLTLLRLN